VSESVNAAPDRVAPPQIAADLPRAYGEPLATASIRTTPEDFVVVEQIGFAPSGAGEHAFLLIEKRGANTDWVARVLARAGGVQPMAVGYAGVKDRHAVARQYFTVHLAQKRDPDWLALQDPEFRVLEATRHARKLPRGALAGNRFELVLRDIDAPRDAIEARLSRIAAHGVPNYFGEQRFGRDGGNVAAALAMFGGRRVQRQERSFLLSAARSHVFNTVLAERVADNSWATALEGDVFQLDGRGSIFGPEPIDDTLRQRVAVLEVHPTGPLWGRGEPRVTADVRALEERVAASLAELCDGLVKAGLEQERRALRLRVADLQHEWAEAGVLRLSFALPPGAYATTVIAEIFRLHDANR
jgi:tRNA pseudouridine13 synthase